MSTPSHSVASPPTQGPASVPEIVVRVLGPVEVIGAARPFARAWTLDLVVYLAMHRRGASSDAWATALWPERLPADPTRHSTVSAARRALGRSGGGRDHLPHSRGVLRLEPSVTTDWERFVALSTLDHPPAWVAALELVRGRPFDGLRAPDWALLDGTAAAVQDAVGALALRVAGHHLGCGDAQAARRAARQGLLASPYDERLYRVLLRAADLEGNPAGVESAMEELVRLLVGDGPGTGRHLRPDIDAVVHPETAALYRALRRPGRAGGNPKPVPSSR